MKNNNITEKLQNDLKTLELGILLLKKELADQAILDETIISNKAKEYLSLVHGNFEHIARDIIPEQLDYAVKEKKSKLRIANDKIRSLELKLGEKVTPDDVCHYIKRIEEQIVDAFKSCGVSIGADISFGEYSINVTIKYIDLKIETTDYVKSQEEIEEIKLKNTKYKDKFDEKFDACCEKNEKSKLLLTERNILAIKEIFNSTGLNLQIDSMETDPYNKNFAVINKISASQSVQNISFNFTRSVYSDEVN